MDLKEAGNFIYLIGEISRDQKPVPDVLSLTPQVYRALHQAIKNRLVHSAHDLSEGGLAVTAAEMCIGGRLGMQINIEASAAFIEANGCLLIEVSAENASAFEKQFADLPITNIGNVISDPMLKIDNEDISVSDLVYAFSNPKHL